MLPAKMLQELRTGPACTAGETFSLGDTPYEDPVGRRITTHPSFSGGPAAREGPWAAKVRQPASCANLMSVSVNTVDPLPLRHPRQGLESFGLLVIVSGTLGSAARARQYISHKQPAA